MYSLTEGLYICVVKIEILKDWENINSCKTERKRKYNQGAGRSLNREMKNGSYPNWWKDIEIKEKSNLIISMLCPCGQKKDAYFVHSFLALELLVFFVIAFFNLPTEYKI